MNHFRGFGDLGKADAALAGGKGASLGEMTNAGIPVPPGYVILAGAFDAFLEETDIKADIEAILTKTHHDVMHEVESASEKIQEIILSQELPQTLRDDILVSFKSLDVKYVAVRSSATAEDGAEHAWAGQLDTYLNTTEDKLLENVKKCWASLFTPRAIFYRFEKGLAATHISVAVVVQKMVASEYSGIAFSVHPVTEDRNQMIIEAGFGLGEAIVSGQVTPDSYVVTKSPRDVTDINVSEQSRALYRAVGGGNEWRELGEKGGTQVLMKEQIFELAEIVMRIENHYRFPCDIEWAFEGGAFYITQSRPITTLSEEVEIKKNALEDIAQWRFWGRWKGSLYWNAPFNSYVHSNVYKKIQPPSGFSGNALSIDGYVYALERDHSIFDTFVVKKFKDDHAWFDNFFQECELIYDRSNKIVPNESVEEVIDIYSDIGATSMFIHFADKALESIVPELAEKSGLSSEVFAKVLVPYKPTFVMQYKTDLEEMNETEINDFLNKYSWIGASYFSGERLTKENVTNEKKQVVRTEQHTSVDISSFDAETQAQIVILQKLIYYRSLNAELANKTINSQWETLTELAKSFNIRREDLSRLTHRELAKAYKDKILPFDFFDRTDDNGISCIDGDINLYFGEDLKKIARIFEHNVKKEEGEVLKGSVAFKGKVTGIAKIVEDVKDLQKVNEGDILVAAETTPDYVVGMKKAAAFVTNQGGITSHAAIVARELRKPCIIGTRVATKVLKDGDLVEVDADSGAVRVLEKKEQEFNADNYVRMFSIPAFPYLFSDLFLNYYKQLNVLSVRGEDVWISFLPKTSLEQTLKDGQVLFSDKKRYQQYADAFEKYMEKSETELTTLVSKPILMATDIQEFSEIVTDLFSYYSKTEFFYTDGISLDNLIVKEKEFEALKSKGRLFMNRVLWEENGYLKTLLGKISVQTNVSVTLLRSYTVEELSTLVQEGIQIDSLVLKERELYAVSSGWSKVGLSSKEVSDFFLKEYPVQSSLLTGMSINKGKVKGRVRVIAAHYANFKKLLQVIESMEEGEILVAETTSPEVIPACKKAAAIVTNQGGVLSHAAIVARELNIPCIIGTNVATRVLQDGDLVEVDADNGVVRLLSSEDGATSSVDRYKKEDFRLVGQWIAPALALDFFCGWTKATFLKNLQIHIPSEVLISFKGFCFLNKEVEKSFEEVFESDFQVRDYSRIQSYLDEADKILENFRALAEAKFDTKNPWSSFLEFAKKYRSIVPAWYGVFMIVPILEKRLKMEISNLGLADKEDQILASIKPYKKILTQEAKDELLIIKAQHGEDLSENNKSLISDVEKYVSKWQWIGTHHLWGDPLTTVKVMEELKDLHETDLSVAGSFPESLTLLLNYAERLSWLRTQSAEITAMVSFHFKNNMESIASGLGFSYEEFIWMSEEEITKMFHGGEKLLKEEIYRRQINPGFIFESNSYRALFDNEITALQKKFEEVEDYSANEIVGKTAYKGKVIGKVKVILVPSQNKGFEHGDILVAAETTPDYLHLMKKASAFVTDAGGITSHAAIVARELKKPCVVGTKKATRVLKDGDLVEVDADNGVVRILQKN